VIALSTVGFIEWMNRHSPNLVNKARDSLESTRSRSTVMSKPRLDFPAHAAHDPARLLAFSSSSNDKFTFWLYTVKRDAPQKDGVRDPTAPRGDWLSLPSAPYTNQLIYLGSHQHHHLSHRHREVRQSPPH